MSQTARPTSDVSTGNWTPTPVYAEIDEENPDGTTTEVSSGSDPTDDTFEVRLAALQEPKDKLGDYTLAVRLKRSGGTDIYARLRLLQGATVIATRYINNPEDSYASDRYSFRLSAGEVSAITNYADLRLEVMADGGLATCSGLEVCFPSGNPTYCIDKDSLRYSSSFSKCSGANLSDVSLPYDGETGGVHLWEYQSGSNVVTLEYGLQFCQWQVIHNCDGEIIWSGNLGFTDNMDGTFTLYVTDTTGVGPALPNSCCETEGYTPAVISITGVILLV